MWDTLVNHEAPVRLGVFLSVFLSMALWEILAPRRVLLAPKAKRWTGNFGILIVNSLLVRAVFPSAAVGIALIAEQRDIGLLHLLSLPQPLSVVLAIVALDLVIYVQHVLFHAVPVLWRLHRVHHADLDIDVTTGARFHPIEILLSMAIKMAAIFLIGAPVLAVLLFEILLNATSMFNHSNVRLPQAVDGLLRLILVTPDMHRVHHSIESAETNSNFGFNLPLWDRLFGTYKDQPDAGHEAMIIGIRDYREPRVAINLPGMLILPFLGRVTGYAINRRSLAGKS